MILSLDSLSLIFGDNVKKTSVQEDLQATYTMLENTVLPSLELTLSKIKELKINKDTENTLKFIAKSTKIKGSATPTTVLSELIKFAKEMLDNKSALEDVIDKELPDYITDRATTARMTGVMGTVSNFNSATMFLMDLNLFLLYKASDENMYYKTKASSIQSMIPVFGITFKMYRGNIRKTIHDISSLSDVEIGDKDTFHLSATKADTKFNLPINGFIGNPIYYIRMWLVEMDINKLEMLEDKKKLIELKLLDLKLSQDGTPNPKLQKQIEYYEDKLADTEYKITKLEK